MTRPHEQALLFFRKAEADLDLLDEVLASPRVGDEIIGFHCQQAAEKLLKAPLSEFGVPFPRTHSLRLLMDLLADSGQPLPDELANLDTLTPFGTLFRYEDVPSDVQLDRQTAREMIRVLRAHAESQV